MSVTADDVVAARTRIADVARPTPVLPSATLSDRLGADVALKAENLQRTGSFKVRGVANKLSALGDACSAGVVAGSAGNHAQALAFAARARGVPCEVFMPVGAPLSKIEGAEALGAKVIVGGESVLECLTAATERAAAAGMTVVHPFDDEHIIAGQGTLGLELLDDVQDMAKVVVPVGGGGLASGMAIAVKTARPDVEVIGVQMDTCAPFAGREVAATRPLTIADGIAVKRPGTITRPLVDRWLDGVVTVSEEEVAEAIVLLMERAKQVVEGAGAVGVAALMFERTPAAAEGTTVAVLSGGNVDSGLLAVLARRHETEMGRRLIVQSLIGDRPGELASLLAIVADGGGNLIEVQHVREGLDLHVRETAVQLTLETRGRDHAESVLAAIRDAGYEARVLR